MDEYQTHALREWYASRALTKCSCKALPHPAAVWDAVMNHEEDSLSCHETYRGRVLKSRGIFHPFPPGMADRDCVGGVQAPADDIHHTMAVTVVPDSQGSNHR